FKLKATEVDHGGKAGLVVEQDPGAGRLKPAMTTIAVNVAKGAPQVVVPDVTGKPVDEAEKLLTDAGLQAGGEGSYVADPDARNGTVVRTAPAAGESADTGSVVEIVAAGASTRPAQPAVKAPRQPRRGHGKNENND